MKVEVSPGKPATAIDADLLVVGLFEDGELPPELMPTPAGAAEARGAFKKLAALHPASRAAALVVGLGKRGDFDAERARVAAALAAKEAAELEATSLAWLLPETGEGAAIAEGIVTGTILASYRFDRFKSRGPRRPGPAADRVADPARARPSPRTRPRRPAICAEAQNRARDLQSLPSNVATPSYLGRRARGDRLRITTASPLEVLGRE